ncbi:MAG: hypothetical protein AMJ62_12250 [Myxococcales bacterium SG8_38]|nr:MAG: hypothetical protein AMJ62_12250 [Myxococcales bacterium SG8_38]
MVGWQSTVSFLLLSLAAWFVAATAFAGDAKIQICHFPPGNMDAFHTISVSEEAASAHMGNHPYDFAGECCEGFDDCDDGDPCTADVCHGFCVNEPADCSDGDPCTTDSCNPSTGCVNEPVICPSDDDSCTADVCDPVTGECISEIRPCSTDEDCNDSNLCTIDNCSSGGTCGPQGSGFCQYATPICIAAPCEIAACDPLQGCIGLPKCQDTDPCTVDTCDPFDETCWFDSLCEDFDECTTDVCDASGQAPVCENTPIFECVPECPCWNAADIANTFGPTAQCVTIPYSLGIQVPSGETSFGVAFNGLLFNQKFDYITRKENNVVTCAVELKLFPDGSDRLEAVLCADLLQNSSICSP